ncbi:hypothetical protein J3B02_000778 [Coemansia erecta]|nr:hypothetical protein J3B02_000778 [Coemansia erecta]
MLCTALKAKNPYRLQRILERMLVENVRQGKHTNVSLKVLHGSAYMILARLLEHREDAMVAAGEVLGEIGWRTQIRPDILITVLAMAAHEATGNEKEYMRSRMCLKWDSSNAALVRSVLQMRGISLRLITDLFDAADDEQSSIGRLEATRFYLACVSHGAVPEHIINRMRSFHNEVASDIARGFLEKRKIGISALALTHLHISAGDMERAKEILDQFATLNLETRWPLGAVSEAIQHKYSVPKDMLPLLVAVSFDDFSEFVKGIERLPVFRTRKIGAAMLRDELEIRRYMRNEHLPITRFFVPRLIIRADNPDIYRLVERHYAEDFESRSIEIDWLIKEASGLAFRLQSIAPLMMLFTKLAQKPELMGAFTAGKLLASMTSVLDSSEMLLQLDESDAKTRSAYIDIAANCTEFRKSLLQMYLRLGIEPNTQQLAIIHNQISSATSDGILSVDQDSKQQLSSLASHILAYISPRNLAQPRLSRTVVFRLFYEQLLRRLAPKYPQAVLKLYEYVAGHPSLTDHHFIMRYTAIMIEEYIENGHFYNKGFFRLEKALIRCLSPRGLPKRFCNTLWPRLWALHMFLRRRRYVVRYKIYPWQLRCQKHNSVFCLKPTPIPSAEKIKAQKIDTRIEPLDPRDKEAAIMIMNDSTPESLPNSKKHSLEKMLQSNTQMIISAL